MMLSIIIPVYNTEQYLYESVHSVLLQDNLELEIILVNDGSTDGSGELCERIAHDYPQVKVIHKANGGPGSARNIGIDHASGDYLAFVDSDDTIAPNTFSINLPVLWNKSVDFLQFPVAVQRKNDSIEIKYRESFQIEGVDRLYSEWLVKRNIANYVCNKIFRKSLFESLRFPEGMYYEDRYLMGDLLEKCHRVAICDHGLYFYRQRPAQTTSLPESEFVLLSKIKADLNIAKHTRVYNTLLNANIERIFNCISYRQKMIDSGWPLDSQIEQDLRHEFPSIQRILRSTVPAGIKIELIKTAILGLRSNS